MENYDQDFLDEINFYQLRKMMEAHWQEQEEYYLKLEQEQEEFYLKREQEELERT